MVNIGWAVGLGSLSFTICLFVVCLHPIGKIRFGGPDAKPTYSKWNWWAISLCAGIGTGIMFWGAVEPLMHSMRPAGGVGLEPGSTEAVIWAMRTTFVHWTLTPYSIYSIAGIAIGYAYYNLGKSYSVSSGLCLLNNGKDLNKTVVDIVDGITLLAITGGVAGSLGYGMLQVGSGLDFVFNIESGPVVWVSIAVVIITAYTISSATGLDKGIKWLSDKNAMIFIGLLIFVIVLGPTAKILNLTTQSIGSYMTNFIDGHVFTDPFGTDLWPQWWDMYFLIDWLSFGPIVGLFLIKLCYGRTFREFIVVNVLLPALFGMIWFGAFGGFALDMQLVQGIDLLSFMDANGIESLMLKVFEYLPFVGIIRPLIIITIMLSFVTLADSMTSTVSLMSMKDNHGVKEAPLSIKLFWGLLMGLTSIIFVLNGGLDGIKVVKTLAGFPILFIELAMMFGFIKYMAKNSRKLIKEEENYKEEIEETETASTN
jgi:choline-glycine betaine transporter